MKKIRTLMLTALALIMGAMTAFASPENQYNKGWRKYETIQSGHL